MKVDGRGETAIEGKIPYGLRRLPSWRSNVAATLGITVNAARQRACQLRRDYREALLAEIAETIASNDPGALEEELGFLYRSVG